MDEIENEGHTECCTELRAKLNATLVEMRLQKKKNAELYKLIENCENVGLNAANNDSFWKLKYKVLEERKDELQRDNYELRRQLAGLTPDPLQQKSSNLRSSPLSYCSNCANLQKQKVQQVQFFERLLLESRRDASEKNTENEKLKVSLKELEKKLASLQSEHDDVIKEKSNNLSLYKRRSERLARRNAVELSGYRNEIELVRTKLKRIDNALTQIRLRSVSKNTKTELLDEFKKLSQDSVAISEILRRLNDKFRP